MNAPINTETQRLNNLCIIASGLLASGHYTTRTEDPYDATQDEPSFLQNKYAEEYKVTRDAIKILNDLRLEVEDEVAQYERDTKKQERHLAGQKNK